MVFLTRVCHGHTEHFRRGALGKIWAEQICLRQPGNLRQPGKKYVCEQISLNTGRLRDSAMNNSNIKMGTISLGAVSSCYRQPRRVINECLPDIPHDKLVFIR